MNSIAEQAKCEQGNESMQTVMIMAVGALILIAVNGLFRQVSPTIRSAIRSVISGESTNLGGGRVSFGSSSSTTSGNRNSGEQSGNPPVINQTRPTSPKPEDSLPKDWFSTAAQDQMPKQLTDASEALRRAIAGELKQHLQVTLPAEATYLDGVIDDLIKTRDQLDLSSAGRRAIEEEISALRRLSHKDLANMMQGLEGRLAINESLSPVLRSLGSMFNVDSMLSQDRTNQRLGRDPNTTEAQAYQAYLDTFRVSSGMLTDGVINAATRGGSSANRASQIANNAGVQVGIGLAADRAGLAIAERAFPTFNSMAHWLYDNGYSPRPPRFPRDWAPPKVYE